MSKKILIISIVCLVVVGMLIWSRVEAPRIGNTDEPSLRVVASFYPLAEFATQVGGDNAHVVSLTPTGVEPHDFDPSPQDIASVTSADVFIYNGAGLEPWVDRILPDLQAHGVTIVRATDHIALDGADPHVWLDPLLAREQVKTIASAMSVSPDAYLTKLDVLDAEFTGGLKQCKRRELVTSHNALHYLAKRYGLQTVSISGISPYEEPTPRRLAEIADFVKAHGVTHIFFETLVSPRLSETIAKETGVKTIAFNPLEGLTDEEIAQGKTYISVQRENLAAIRTALGCI